MNHSAPIKHVRRNRAAKLTGPASAAHKHGMAKIWRRSVGVAAMTATIGLGGCVTLEAPDKPIVIELNINITQEVIYRLAEDAGNTIDENADIF